MRERGGEGERGRTRGGGGEDEERYEAEIRGGDTKVEGVYERWRG